MSEYIFFSICKKIYRYDQKQRKKKGTWIVNYIRTLKFGEVRCQMAMSDVVLGKILSEAGVIIRETHPL